MKTGAPDAPVPPLARGSPARYGVAAKRGTPWQSARNNQGFVAETAIREMVRVGLAPKSSNVVVLGITFKENCPDVRNSKVYDIVMRLKEYGVEPSVVDPWASGDEVKQVYGMQLRESGDIANADCLIVAVAHDEFKELGFERIDAFFGDKPDESKVLLDVKGILDAKRFSSYGSFWRL